MVMFQGNVSGLCFRAMFQGNAIEGASLLVNTAQL